MDLKTYILSLDRDSREELALRCKTTAGHIHNVMHGYRTCSPELAVLIETETSGAVTRKELRPYDWMAIWPELVGPSKKAA